MKSIVAAMLISLLLFALLVSGKLVEIAERQPLGDSRDRWLNVAEGTDRVSNFLALNRPYDLITGIRGVGADAGERVDSIEAVATALGREREPIHPRTQEPTLVPRPRPTATPLAAPPPAAPSATNIPRPNEPSDGPDSNPVSDAGPPAAASGVGLEPDTAENPEPPGTGPEKPDAALQTLHSATDFDGLALNSQPAPPEDSGLSPTKLRTVTPDDPLRVYVAGDSQAFYPGHALTGVEGASFLDVTVDSRHSTGLARPDLFNWPAELLDIAAEHDPELVVIFIGGNDWQPMQAPEGELLRRGTDGWLLEWMWRLEVALDALAASHRHTVLVSLPPARPEPFRTGYSQINELSRTVSLSRSDVTLVDIWELFGGNDPYRDRVAPPSGGDQVRVRQQDGIHLNRTGAKWVAAMVFEVAAERWDLGAA